MNKIFFEVKRMDSRPGARAGVIHTPHGSVQTPAFLPIGTKGSVKTVTAEELKFWGTEIILANTYHLWIRPGDALIHQAGGLHKFIGWDGPIFTDSGGFQVFSLGEKSNSHRQKKLNDQSLENTFSNSLSPSRSANAPVLKRITEAGVEFQNELDGTTHLLTPESSIQIQSNLGSDIALVLDDVPALPATEERIAKSLQLTALWAERAKRHYQKIVASSVNPGQKLYGIVQGGDFEKFRRQSVAGLQKIGFDGYGIGGLAVGESADVMYRVLGYTLPFLEPEKPRHLLGVGFPEQILKAVSFGVDTFDCVIPTRHARHGELFVNEKSGGYRILKITHEEFKEDFTPVDNTCNCYGCLHHNRAYLRHLLAAGEPLGIRLATMHNLRFYLNFMEKIRQAIEFDSFREMLDNYRHE